MAAPHVTLTFSPHISHATCQGRQPSDSGEKKIKRFYLYGRGGHLGHVTRTI